MSKRTEIDEYTNEVYNWQGFKLYGLLSGSPQGELNSFDKFFGIETSNDKFLHADTFTNGDIFLFCMVIDVLDQPKYLLNVFLKKDTFLELISNDKQCILGLNLFNIF